MTTPPIDQPFTDFPAVTSATPATEVPDWFYLRRRQVEGLAGQLGPRSDFSKETMEALGRKLRAMETRLTQGDLHATVVADFRAWAGQYSNDGGAWDYYVNWQKEQDQARQATLRELPAMGRQDRRDAGLTIAGPGKPI